MKIDAEKYRKKYPFITRLFRMMKFYFLLFVRKEDSPERIAHGLAIGIFVGFLPIIPLQSVTTLLLCTIFKTNKLAGVIGSTALTKPITAIPVFYAQHFLGRIFILKEFSYEKFVDLFKHISVNNLNELGSDLLALFNMVTIGGVIVGVFFYPFVYYITKRSIIRRREKMKLRKKKKFILI
jgi:uncharacterized protein